MKFLQLHIKNFLTIGNAAPIHLDGKGLVLIQGVNEDDTSATSNGVGKSSIPDALCWALYGVTARDVSGDSVVNKTAKKDCSVEVKLQDGDTIYRITRYRKHKEFKNQTTIRAGSVAISTMVEMAKGTEKETQEVINGIMGCSVDVFRAAIYAGQESMPDLPKMTDKQLKLLIEEAAGVERLEGAYMKAREQWSGVKAQVDRHTADKLTLQGRFAATSIQLEEAKITSLEFEETRSVRNKELQINGTSMKTTMIRNITEIKAMNEPALKEGRDSIDLELSENAKVVAGERAVSESLGKAQGILNRAQLTAERSKRDAVTTKTVIDNAAEEMKKPCAECGKPHTEDELAEFVAVQQTKLKAQIERAKMDSGAAASAERMVEEQLNNLIEYRSKMPDVSALMEKKRELDAEIRTIATRKNELQLLKKDHDMNAERASKALTEANPSAAVINHLEIATNEIKDQLSVVGKKIDELQDKSSLYENVVKVFSPAGVRAHILDSVTPMLNARTAEYLSALSDGNITAVWSTLSTTAKGELKEKFNIEVVNEKGAESFAGLSGGEKRKVRLSTMLALQDLVASRATKPIELWIGDEIDDALDTAGLERLMGVLEGKARERGTVLVVSHNELRDWIDNVVTVTKRGGLSVIEGALS